MFGFVVFITVSNGKLNMDSVWDTSDTYHPMLSVSTLKAKVSQSHKAKTVNIKIRGLGGVVHDHRPVLRQKREK